MKPSATSEFSRRSTKQGQRHDLDVGLLSWSLSAGALPPGMSQSGEYIYGTPESAGTYQFTVKVTDSGASPQTATKKYTLKVS